MQLVNIIRVMSIQFSVGIKISLYVGGHQYTLHNHYCYYLCPVLEDIIE